MSAVAVIGLGAMGLPMSLRLMGAGLDVRGADLSPAARDRFAAAGGTAFASAGAAAQGAQALLLLVVNDAQAEQVLFDDGAAAALAPGAVVILSLTTSPQRAAALGARLAAQQIAMVDCPVSGGVKRAQSGTLALLASGPRTALDAARPFLTALGHVHELGERHGQASTVKLINQLLCGVHIAAAAEAVALAERAGVDSQQLYEVIMASSGASHMFADRVPAMIGAQARGAAAIDVLVKDLDLVADLGTQAGAELRVAQAARALFRDAAAQGLGALNDSEIIRLLRG